MPPCYKPEIGLHAQKILLWTTPSSAPPHLQVKARPVQNVGIATLREVLGILHGLEKFHHCFAREVSIIRHSHLVTADPVYPPQDTSIKGQNTIQTRAGKFLLQIGCPDRTTRKTKMHYYVGTIRVDAIQASMNVPKCMSVQKIQQATAQDEHLQQLKGLIISGWPESKEQVHQDLRVYWSFRDNMGVIDAIIMKGRCIVIPEALKQQVLDQLHINHMGIEKTELVAHKSIYWTNINKQHQKFHTKLYHTSYI